MTPSGCPDCTLFQFFAHWLFSTAPFWIFLIIIVLWIDRVITFFRTEQDSEGEYDYTRWLEPHIKTRSHVVHYFILHLFLLAIELVEGYWILCSWAGHFKRHWHWKLKNHEWDLQFWRFIVLLVLCLVLPVLLLIGFFLVSVAVSSMIDLCDWEAKSMQRRKGKDKQQ